MPELQADQSGDIFDESGVSIAGVRVVIENTKFGAISSTDVSYEIRNIPAGTHTILLDHVSYEPCVVEDVDLIHAALTSLS